MSAVKLPKSVCPKIAMQAVFCAILGTAQATSPWFESLEDLNVTGELWKTGVLATGAVYLQLVWGALLRHTGRGLLLHAGWAAAVCATLLLLAARAAKSDHAALTRPAALLLTLLPFQLALGYVSYRLRFHSPSFGPGLNMACAMTAAHLSVGALILGTVCIWTMRAYRTR